MKLSGQQYQKFTVALLDAFPARIKLAQMLRFRLEKNLDAIAMGGDLQEIVFKLIEASEAEGWTINLLAAARESNPGNPKLLAFSQEFGLASSSVSQQALERTIRKTNSFLDVEKWRTQLGEMEGRVCRVEITLNKGVGISYGTGFLLGPNVLITNYHVMEAVIEGERRRSIHKTPWATSEDVVLHFDYKCFADGITLNFGTEYKLAEDWLIDYSPYSQLDFVPEPKQGVPQTDQLDYALLRIAGQPGYDPLGQKPEPEAPKRGWINVSTKTYDFEPSTPLLILQHPKANPLKLAFATDAIIGLNANRTRVTYRTNTEQGSSGSPCFNINWELVALHHFGDPDFTPGHKPVYNQGIPFSAILDLLEQRGHKNKLSNPNL